MENLDAVLNFDVDIIAITALCASVLTALLGEAWRRFALRSAILDKPNIRSSHSTAMPRGVGISLFVSFFAAGVVVAGTGNIPDVELGFLAIAGCAIVVVGLWDDIQSVSVQVRLAVQFFASGGAVALIGVPDSLDLSQTYYGATILVGFVLALGIVWHVNLFNFMDGIDGLALTQAGVTCLNALWIATFLGNPQFGAMYLVLAACCLGLLALNWPPAQAFIGDSGSGFLGFALAVLALLSVKHNELTIWTWLILLSLFASDATVTLLRRWVRGCPLHVAHRSHAYQVWAAHTANHRVVTVAFAGINLVWLGPLAAMSANSPDLAHWIAIVAIFPVVVAVWCSGAGASD